MFQWKSCIPCQANKSPCRCRPYILSRATSFVNDCKQFPHGFSLHLPGATLFFHCNLTNSRDERPINCISQRFILLLYLKMTNAIQILKNHFVKKIRLFVNQKNMCHSINSINKKCYKTKIKFVDKLTRKINKLNK